MPVFSMSSMEKLKTCHEDLQTIFKTVVKIRDCTIAVGHRGKEDQDKAVREGASKNPWPSSKHNTTPSMAADVYPYPPPDWKNTTDFLFFGGFVMGVATLLFEQGVISHKLRYGADWDKDGKVSDERFLDLGHFELYDPYE